MRAVTMLHVSRASVAVMVVRGTSFAEVMVSGVEALVAGAEARCCSGGSCADISAAAMRREDDSRWWLQPWCGGAAEKMVAMEVARRGGCYCANE